MPKVMVMVAGGILVPKNQVYLLGLTTYLRRLGKGCDRHQ
jgi:hypothetical protein